MYKEKKKKISESGFVPGLVRDGGNKFRTRLKNKSVNYMKLLLCLKLCYPPSCVGDRRVDSQSLQALWLCLTFPGKLEAPALCSYGKICPGKFYGARSMDGQQETCMRHFLLFSFFVCKHSYQLQPKIVSNSLLLLVWCVCERFVLEEQILEELQLL